MIFPLLSLWFLVYIFVICCVMVYVYALYIMIENTYGTNILFLRCGRLFIFQYARNIFFLDSIFLFRLLIINSCPKYTYSWKFFIFFIYWNLYLLWEQYFSFIQIYFQSYLPGLFSSSSIICLRFSSFSTTGITSSGNIYWENLLYVKLTPTFVQ